MKVIFVVNLSVKQVKFDTTSFYIDSTSEKDFIKSLRVRRIIDLMYTSTKLRKTLCSISSSS